MEIPPNLETILAIDVGERRIGVARARLDTSFPQPLTTLDNPDMFIDDLQRLVQDERAALVVIGLPRGLGGQETAQTTAVREFAAALKPHLGVPLFFTDEAVTSEHAENELKQRGKPYAKADIDALAATYILDDFLREQSDLSHLPEVGHV
jgi:putative holliday junction resolvase